MIEELKRKLSRKNRQDSAAAAGHPRILWLILSGWGVGKPNFRNAIFAANPPYVTHLWNTRPHAELEASGRAVGLLGGQPPTPFAAYLAISSGRALPPHNFSEKRYPAVKHLLPELLNRHAISRVFIAERPRYHAFMPLLNPHRGHERETRIILNPLPSSHHLEGRSEDLAAHTVEQLLSGRAELIVANFSNLEAVAERRDFKLTTTAVRLLDSRVREVVEIAAECGYTVVISGDYGGAEEALDHFGDPRVGPTTASVPFIIIDEDAERLSIRENGSLSDLAPTLLSLFGIPAPREMTGRSLFTGEDDELAAVLEEIGFRV